MTLSDTNRNILDHLIAARESGNRVRNALAAELQAAEADAAPFIEQLISQQDQTLEHIKRAGDIIAGNPTVA